MKNAEIAAIFEQMADLLEILGESSFRVLAYRRCAQVLTDLTEDVEKLDAEGRLDEVPGIGKSSAEKIHQYLTEGKIDRYEELSAKVPAGLPALMKLSGLGPKTAVKLWKEAGIGSLAELREALQKEPERITKIHGMGVKKVQQIQDSLAFAESAAGRIRINQALEIAEGLVEQVAKIKGVIRATYAGSLRRGRETIGDIDLLCAATGEHAQRIIKEFTSLRGVRRVTAMGTTKGSVQLAQDVQADLRVVPEESFGAALAYFTGSKGHNVRLREIAVKKGLKLNEYGLFAGKKRIAGAREEEIYDALGLRFVPPELREDRGEIEAAAEGELPELLELSDVRGDLHVHTNASDGANTIEEMVQAARALKYKYLCISDHSKGQYQANGLDEKRLAEHVKAIRAASDRYKDITVLAGCEVDILKDGTLDFEADVLGTLDLVTASAHAGLTMPGQEATKRLIRAMESRHVHVVGHPSGRIINGRRGMDIDIEKIAQAAAANNVALEINADPSRLDLRDTHVKAAIDAGAKIAINTDAHSTGHLGVIKYGVITARRGWARAADVINTYTPAKLKAFLKDR